MLTSKYFSALFLAAAAFPLLAQPVPQLTPPTKTEAESSKTLPEKSAAGTAAPEKHDLTKEDSEAWLDGFVPYALQRGDVAGAVVVVVKDGQVLLAKGYGYSDVSARKPVDPEKTLFRAGSVSKLYTWTAVMQLVEQGKIDLDKDVNTYIDYKIPARGTTPITMRNLMTHTAGFDEQARALITNDANYLASLGDLLKSRIPPRVTDAGSTPAYSNYGAALAGYIVERVSGEPFDDYIDKHIFNPLGMKYATFRQPLPKELEPFMSKGYQLASGEPKPFEIVSVAPAGSISISGADTAKFMIAHLQNGSFESQRILQEKTAVMMHGTANTIIPPLHRMLLGFYENDLNGHRVVTHAGDTEYFHSELNLYPDDNVGLYISMNSLGKEGAAGTIREMLFRQFGDRYFPGPGPEGQVDPETAKKHAQMMAGRYVLSRRSHESFLALLGLLGQATVAPTKEGSISVAGLKGPDGVDKKWREISPFVWRDADSNERLAAKVDGNQVTRFGVDAYPFMIFEPVPWWSSAGWLMPLFVISLIVLALTVLAWPTSAFVRRHYAASYGLTGPDARAHRLIRLVSVFVLGIIILWVFTVQMMLSNLDWASPRYDTWVSTLRILTFVILILGAVTAVWNAAGVLRSGRRKLAKLWSIILAIACLTLLYVGFVFHLVGYASAY